MYVALQRRFSLSAILKRLNFSPLGGSCCWSGKRVYLPDASSYRYVARAYVGGWVGWGGGGGGASTGRRARVPDVRRRTTIANPNSHPHPLTRTRSRTRTRTSLDTVPGSWREENPLSLHLLLTPPPHHQPFHPGASYVRWMIWTLTFISVTIFGPVIRYSSSFFFCRCTPWLARPI